MGKAEVVDGKVGLRQDDGHYPIFGREVPFGEVNINKRIGHALEEHLRADLSQAFDAHAAAHLVLAGREGSYPLGKGLRSEFVDVSLREGVCRAEADGTQRRYAFAQDEVVGTNEAVFLREDGFHVAIELQAHQDNHHAQKVGKEEACQLRQTDVTAKKFPDKSHRHKVLS